MKKFFKWAGIVLGMLVLILILYIVYVFVSHDRYQITYNSGGELSPVQAAMDIISYDLNLEIFPDDQAINAVATVTVQALTDDLEQLEFDLIGNFDVTRISTGASRQLSYQHDGGKLMIDWGQPLEKNEPVQVAIYYNGQPLEAIFPPWFGGFNWSADSSGSHWIGVSCQGEGADIWFPCKDHQSDKPDSVALNITIPEDYYCAANGLLQTVTNPRPGYATYHWTTHYPISNYNVNINVGKFEIVERSYLSETGMVMPVRYYVLPQGRKGADVHLDMALDMLYTYRKFYGEYPFSREKFAIVQTDYLGMEHQTINAYGNNYNYQTIDGLTFDQLMLHEMGHEWWGNKVTAGDLADMWIQEGICTYGEALYVEDKLGPQAYHNYMRKIKGRIANSKPIIPKRNANDSEVYQRDIYYKGAALMHSLRFMFGDEQFFRLLKTFATDSAYTYKNTVSTDDFIQLVDKISGKNHRAYLDQFLYTTDLIRVDIDSLQNSVYKISLPNVDYSLPMEIALDDTVIRVELDRVGLELESELRPVIDPQEWYLISSRSITDNTGD